MRKNMINRNTFFWMSACLVVLFLAAGQRIAFASSISETVTVNTSGLPATPGSEIFFILTDGSGTGDANNTATLSAFTFGGGTAGAVDAVSSTGGVSGDMGSGVSITDSGFPNILAQYFTAGSSVSFGLNLTTNVDPGSTPDQFGFVILDPGGNPIPTSDLTGSNYLAVINIDSSNPSSVSYSDLVTITPQGPVSTPEPATLFLLAAGLAALALSTKRPTTLT
jgi:hypothetical protein